MSSLNDLNDDDFLLWVGKRLIHKYKEHPLILNRIIKIVAKHRLIVNSYTESNKNTLSGIIQTINGLQTLGENLKVQHHSLINKIKTTNMDNLSVDPLDFDNIDVDALIRGI